MLVLSRKLGEAIRIGPDVRIRIVALQGSQVRLAIEAPDSVVVHREEIYERIAQANREATRDGADALQAFGSPGLPQSDEEGS